MCSGTCHSSCSRSLDGGGLLAFEAVGVDGVEQVDGEAVDEVGEDADAAVEVGLELDGEGAVVHGLRELAPGDLAFGDEDDAAEAGAGGVGGHGGGGVAGGGAGDPLEPRSAATERAAVMPVSLKEPVGFMP